MAQYSIESMTGHMDSFQVKLSDDFNIAGLQEQAASYCFQSKGFLCSYYAAPFAPASIFAKMMKDHMSNYKKDSSNRNNPAMKLLYETDIETLYRQISMLAMHAQFKDVDDIFNVSRDEESRSLDPKSVYIGISLYVYYTILVNTSIDASSYNELFIKSWFYYYEYWGGRRLMLQLNGNKWKAQFKGVLME